MIQDPKLICLHLQNVTFDQVSTHIFEETTLNVLQFLFKNNEWTLYTTLCSLSSDLSQSGFRQGNFLLTQMSMLEVEHIYTPLTTCILTDMLSAPSSETRSSKSPLTQQANLWRASDLSCDLCQHFAHLEQKTCCHQAPELCIMSSQTIIVRWPAAAAIAIHEDFSWGSALLSLKNM